MQLTIPSSPSLPLSGESLCHPGGSRCLRAWRSLPKCSLYVLLTGVESHTDYSGRSGARQSYCPRTPSTWAGRSACSSSWTASTFMPSSPNPANPSSTAASTARRTQTFGGYATNLSTPTSGPSSSAWSSVWSFNYVSVPPLAWLPCGVC